MNTPYKKIAAAIDVPDIESKDGGVYLSTDQMQAIEDKLEASELTDQVTTLNTTITDLNEKLETKNNELTAANQEVEQLKAKVTALENTAAPDDDVVVETRTNKNKKLTVKDLNAKWAEG